MHCCWQFQVHIACLVNLSIYCAILFLNALAYLKKLKTFSTPTRTYHSYLTLLAPAKTSPWTLLWLCPADLNHLSRGRICRKPRFPSQVKIINDTWGGACVIIFSLNQFWSRPKVMGLPSFRGHGASRLSQPKPQRRQDGGKWMAQWRSVRCRSHWSHSWRFTRLGWWQRWWEIPAQGLNMPEIHVTVVVSCSTFLMEPGEWRVKTMIAETVKMKCCRSLTRNRTLQGAEELGICVWLEGKVRQCQCDMDCPWDPRGQVELKKSKPAGSQADMQLRLND